MTGVPGGDTTLLPLRDRARRLMDRVARHSALGLRFWDVAEQTSAIDGLVVEVFSRANPRARVAAFANRSGVYVAHAVPGLRDFEMADAEPDELWTAAARAYRVEVSDPAGRFLPLTFDADLPARGVFTWRAPWFSPPQAIVFPMEPGSPPQLLVERVPLFSAPSRPVPDPLAVVRAQLHDDTTGREAAWALLGVSIDGELRGLGLADEHGRVAVMFPYPEPSRRTLASPPEARSDFTWEVALTAFTASASPSRAAIAPMPDLAELLGALATPRPVVHSLHSPGAPLRLFYRRELTVRTEGAAGAAASLLMISA